MPNEVSFIAFVAMVEAFIVNIISANYCTKAKRLYEKRHKELIDFLFDSRTKSWKRKGAYEAPEHEQLYLDLEGGLRLVIYEGKIEGWYMA